MKHFPNERPPAKIEGLEHTQAPLLASRRTVILFALVLYFAGFFTGAIAFGEILIASIPNQEAAR